MSELTPDDDEETVNLTGATIIFSSCAILFGLERKGVISACMIQGYLQCRKHGIYAPGVFVRGQTDVHVVCSFICLSVVTARVCLSIHLMGARGTDFS